MPDTRPLIDPAIWCPAADACFTADATGAVTRWTADGTSTEVAWLPELEPRAIGGWNRGPSAQPALVIGGGDVVLIGLLTEENPLALEASLTLPDGITAVACLDDRGTCVVAAAGLPALLQCDELDGNHLACAIEGLPRSPHDDRDWSLAYVSAFRRNGESGLALAGCSGLAFWSEGSVLRHVEMADLASAGADGCVASVAMVDADTVAWQDELGVLRLGTWSEPGRSVLAGPQWADEWWGRGSGLVFLRGDTAFAALRLHGSGAVGVLRVGASDAVGEEELRNCSSPADLPPLAAMAGADARGAAAVGRLGDLVWIRDQGDSPCGVVVHPGAEDLFGVGGLRWRALAGAGDVAWGVVESRIVRIDVRGSGRVFGAGSLDQDNGDVPLRDEFAVGPVRSLGMFDRGFVALAEVDAGRSGAQGWVCDRNGRCEASGPRLWRASDVSCWPGGCVVFGEAGGGAEAAPVAVFYHGGGEMGRVQLPAAWALSSGATEREIGCADDGTCAGVVGGAGCGEKTKWQIVEVRAGGVASVAAVAGGAAECGDGAVGVMRFGGLGLVAVGGGCMWIRRDDGVWEFPAYESDGDASETGVGTAGSDGWIGFARCGEETVGVRGREVVALAKEAGALRLTDVGFHPVAAARVVSSFAGGIAIGGEGLAWKACESVLGGASPPDR
jgi:hypothetical protein